MLYQLYVAGRDALGLVFKRHRTHQAFEVLSQTGPRAAWKQACIDNSTAGNPKLPAFVKATMEVTGVLLLALYGFKHWRFASVAAVLLLSQTASERGGDNVSSHDWNNDPDWNEEGAQEVRNLLNELRPGLGDDVDRGTRKRFLEMGDE